MRKLISICAGLAMMFTAATAMAADVTGTWTTQATGPDGGTMQLSFTFKQDGSTLTGTVQGPMGDAMAITNGKVDGDKFSFDVSFNGMTINHQCTVDGATIKMTTKSDSGDFPGMQLTLTRAKDAAPTAPAAPAAPTAPATPPQ